MKTVSATETTAPARTKALLLLCVSAVLFSTSGLLIKSVDLHPVALAGMRSAFASLVMLAALRRPRFIWSPVQLGGALVYAATVILFVSATKMTTAANAILLQYTAPIYAAAFGAWFLDERASWRDWLTISIVLGGMGLFFLDRLAAGSWIGNVLAVLSGVGMAALAVLLRGQKDGSPLESVLLGNLLTALIGLPFLARGLPAPAGWGGLLLMGLFQLGLPYLLYASAIKHVTALESTLFTMIEPLLNPVWVFLVLGEAPSPWAMTGGLVILGALALRYLVPGPGGRGRS